MINKVSCDLIFFDPQRHLFSVNKHYILNSIDLSGQCHFLLVQVEDPKWKIALKSIFMLGVGVALVSGQRVLLYSKNALVD